MISKQLVDIGANQAYMNGICACSSDIHCSKKIRGHLLFFDGHFYSPMVMLINILFCLKTRWLRNCTRILIRIPNVCFLLLGGKGHALLILRPEELGFLRYLRQANVPLNEFEFSWSKVSDIQPQLEKLISKNYFLNLSAKEAFKGYARAYESHSLKQVNDIY